MKLAVFCFGLNVYGINSAIIVQCFSFLFSISKLDGIDEKIDFKNWIQLAVFQDINIKGLDGKHCFD